MGWFQGGQWGGSKTQGWMRAVAAVATFTGFDPANKTAGITLSENNARAAGNSGNGARSYAPRNTAGWNRVEFRINKTTSINDMGLANDTLNPAANGVNNPNMVLGVRCNGTGGSVFVVGNAVANMPANDVNGIVGLEWNTSTGGYSVDYNGAVVTSGTTTVDVVKPFAGSTLYNIDLNINIGPTLAYNPNNRSPWGGP